jgi:hypothetical protein
MWKQSRGSLGGDGGGAEGERPRRADEPAPREPEPERRAGTDEDPAEYEPQDPQTD